MIECEQTRDFAVHLPHIIETPPRRPAGNGMGHSSFVLRAYFDIRISTFDILRLNG
jgi:hypothetical protein